MLDQGDAVQNVDGHYKWDYKKAATDVYKLYKIVPDGMSEFIFMTSNHQNTQLNIRFTEDLSKKAIITTRLGVGNQISVWDLLLFKGNIRCIIGRDEEEFSVYEFKPALATDKIEPIEGVGKEKKDELDFIEPTISVLYTSSHYVFKWPFIVFVWNKKVLIYNCYED